MGQFDAAEGAESGEFTDGALGFDTGDCTLGALGFDTGDCTLGALGSDTGEFTEGALGFDTGDFALGALGVEVTLSGDGALTTVTDELVSLSCTFLPSMTEPRSVIAPPGTTLPSSVRRSIVLAAATAPPARTPSPTTPVTPYVIHFFMFMGFLRGCFGYFNAVGPH